MKKRVLILSDGKLGHQNQSVRLAEMLDVEYEILTLERRKWSKLASYIFPSYIIKNARALKQQFFAVKYDAVIGIGTVPRLALVWLKKLKPSIKTICIMDPKTNYDSYDVIISPNHDGLDSTKLDNVINVTGSLSYFKQEDLDFAKEDFRSEFAPYIENPLIGLVIGGDAGSYKFSMLKAQDILDKAFILSNKLNSNIYTTTSRRTPQTQVDYIKYRMDKSENPIYVSGERNPYRAIMAYSSIIIVTPETVSMLMESCATDALVLIADRNSVKSKRLRAFSQELIDKGMLFDLDEVLCKDNLEDLIASAKDKPKFSELEKAVEHIKSKNIL